MQTVKNILFDLGGVFLPIDYAKTEQAFIELGITNFNELFTQHHANPLFEDLETGKISEPAFYAAFRASTRTNLTDDQIRNAWNALLLKFPAENIQWLENIKSRYNIYLFSNTNIIHYKEFIKIFATDFAGQDFNSHFIKAYYSHELGLRKPYTASFRHILTEQQLDPATTLFIDDTAANIHGAKQAGLQAHHLLTYESLRTLNL